MTGPQLPPDTDALVLYVLLILFAAAVASLVILAALP